MCQTHSKRLHSVYAKGYRVYITRDNGTLSSYYGSMNVPKKGQKAGYEPFHMWRNKKSLMLWLEHRMDYEPKYVFECVLSGKLKVGQWFDNTNMKTCKAEQV